MKPPTGQDDAWRTAGPVTREPSPRPPYKVRRTLMGWMVTNRSHGYTFTTSFPAALEQVGRYELDRVAGWDWGVYPVPGGAIYLIGALTGETHRFRTYQQAALFLTARAARLAARKASA